ncbi:phage tail protein [Kordiimonas sp.]|uniref:phage tail protein n=1 Tax=Kordiimonas sp. TaxID=1970157 RepID=UPI003A91C6AD
MFDQYIGVIKALGFNFVPESWGYCGGALLAINQFDALFSLIGCRFGGDCRSSFGLPDLRGRAPMGQGAGPGLTPREMGDTPGQYKEVLASQYMPSHKHSITYTGGGSSDIHTSAPVTVRVASSSGGQKPVPDDGDYIAGPGNALGTVQNNLFLAPADVTSKVAISGVFVAGSGGFDNNGLSIEPTPVPTSAVILVQPSQAVNYNICMEGLYPSRS